MRLVRLLGFDYRPQLADLPDAKLWRINPGADYGPLTTAARGKIDRGRSARTGPIRCAWPGPFTPARSAPMTCCGCSPTGATRPNSPYMRRHLNVHGHYSFQLPDLAGTRRVLRDPDASDDDHDR